MPNNSVRAAAEGLPAPSLIETIAAFQAGEAAYSAHPIVKMSRYTDEQEEAAIAETYGPPLALLSDWDQPATSREEAVAAIRCAQRDCPSGSSIIDNMLRAAVAYFDAPAVTPEFQAVADKFTAALAEYRAIDNRMTDLLNSLPNDVLFREGLAAREAKENAGLYKLDELQEKCTRQCAEAFAALLEYPCASLEEVQTKARLMLPAPSGFGGDLEINEAQTLLRSILGVMS